MVHKGGTLDAQVEEVCRDCGVGQGGGQLGQCSPLFESFLLFWLQ